MLPIKGYILITQDNTGGGEEEGGGGGTAFNTPGPTSRQTDTSTTISPSALNKSGVHQVPAHQPATICSNQFSQQRNQKNAQSLSATAVAGLFKNQQNMLAAKPAQRPKDSSFSFTIFFTFAYLLYF